MSKRVAFRTKVQLHGKTATGIQVPATAVAAFASGKRPKVKVTIGPHSYRSTVMPMGGRYLLPLAAEHRTAAGVAAGETVRVTLELDMDERTVEIPPALTSAMRRAPGTRAAFDRLSYTRRKEIALAVSSAKQEDTRERRIAKAIAELKAAQPKPT
jgi:hypothetical protein